MNLFAELLKFSWIKAEMEWLDGRHVWISCSINDFISWLPSLLFWLHYRKFIAQQQSFIGGSKLIAANLKAAVNSNLARPFIYGRIRRLHSLNQKKALMAPPAKKTLIAVDEIRLIE